MSCDGCNGTAGIYGCPIHSPNIYIRTYSDCNLCNQSNRNPLDIKEGCFIYFKLGGGGTANLNFCPECGRKL